MKKKKSDLDIEWKEWWRNNEGRVSLDMGFHFNRDPDIWYFDIDPETQREQLDDSDSRMVHVDYLFDNKDEATEAALEWCEEQEEDLISKMQDLGVWSRHYLNRELEEEYNDHDD